MLELMEKIGHWRLDQDGDGILWLTLDRAGSPVNTLSSDVLG
jgi:3-hydroxyacyl-CoA dehydrogenase/enoyl-CoA hydratase/3-hydroxybutyryl-CoA epimerase